MRVCVAGLWHLGSVTAACLALGGHQVVGFDDDAEVVGGLARGEPPLFEPRLAELVQDQMSAGHLSFTNDATVGLEGAEVLWVTYDTPVDEDDVADVDFVLSHIETLLSKAPAHCLVLVSSQLPVGSTATLARRCREDCCPNADLRFGYSPENLRLGKAIEVFTQPDRVVVGLEAPNDREKVLRLLAPFTDKVIFMSVSSAEMTKHAINAFLAMSVAFANEIALICEQTGADASEVARGLKSESRIGPAAYVSPGIAFAGGTLARDIAFLGEAGDRLHLPLALLPSVRVSNDRHRSWPFNRLSTLLGAVAGKRIALLGLTYKPGTDTLRRSSAVELARALTEAGAEVRAFDPAVRNLPQGLDLQVQLTISAPEALAGADAAVITTAWPEFRQLDWPALAVAMRGAVLDRSDGTCRGPRKVAAGRAHLCAGRQNDGSRVGLAMSRHLLAGRTAIITGANRGLGLEIAQAYAGGRRGFGAGGARRGAAGSRSRAIARRLS